MIVRDGVLEKVQDKDLVEIMEGSIVKTTFINWKDIHTIGKKAFESYVRVDFLDIPSTVKVIEDNAFDCCDNLKEVIIEDGVESIGKNAFTCCRKLEYVKLPKELKQLSFCLFFNCDNLKTVIMPESLEKIDDYAFSGCEKLETVYLNEGIKTIGNHAFSSCHKLKILNIPSTVEYIGDNCFLFCHALEKIELPDNMQIIESETFNSCSSLKEVKLPKSLTKIGKMAFYRCKSIESIDIPSTVEEIGSLAFCSCLNLKNIELPSNLKIIENRTFEQCMKLQISSLPKNIESIGETAFFGCYSIFSFTMPENLKYIGSRAFANCEQLKKIVMDENLKSINVKAFEGCKNLQEVIFANYVEDIRYSSFDRCYEIKTLQCKDEIYDMNNCPSLLLDSTKDAETKMIKIITTLNEPYSVNHDVKFPHFFLTSLNNEQLKCLLKKENVKYFKDIYKGYVEKCMYEDEDVRDFYKFAYVLGCFDNEEVMLNGKKVNIAQKMSVFFKYLLDSGQICVDDCHELFDGLKTKKYNLELLKFITLHEKKGGKLVYDNFKYLMDKKYVINRIINDFDKILKTVVTDKEGRIIKNPSIRKRIEIYLLTTIFEDVEPGNEDIAQEFSKFPSIGQASFNEAQDIRRKESYLRHIVKEPLFEENIIQSINKIKEQINEQMIDSKLLIDELFNKEFTYEWLDKHDPKNFTLGLYCDCCASIVSEHYGKIIMKESITRDDVQNLVIKDNSGTIVAKATIYVNKEKGYAVFNDIEMNRSYGNEMGENDTSDNKQRIKIYNAFKRGVKAFVDKYNEMYKDTPLVQVNIGWGYNRLKQIIKSCETKSQNNFEVLNSFMDAKKVQWIIYKK